MFQPSRSTGRYVKHSNFPPQMYVRISNRLQGESLLTQNNIVNPQVKPDAVAMGCWSFDQHTMSRNLVTDQAGQKTLRNEGLMRAALGSHGLSCDHPMADCSEGASWYGSKRLGRHILIYASCFRVWGCMAGVRGEVVFLFHVWHC